MNKAVLKQALRKAIEQRETQLEELKSKKLTLGCSVILHQELTNLRTQLYRLDPSLCNHGGAK